MPAEDDAEVVARLRAGDEAAAEEFDRRFRARIERIAHRRGVPLDDCPDVAQDVLTDAVRQLRRGNFRGEASLTTWLHALIQGNVATYYRRRRDKLLVPIDSLAEDDPALARNSA